MTLDLTDVDTNVNKVPISPEEAFITFMSRDRPGRFHCTDSTETLETWYRSGERSNVAVYQHQVEE